MTLKKTRMKRHPVLMKWKNNIVKISILSKMIYRFKAIPIKIPTAFFSEIEKNPKFIWSHKGHRLVKTILRGENKARHVTLPDFKIYYNAVVNKTPWQWHKDRHIKQYNGKGSPKVNPHIYSQLIFNKGPGIHNGKKTVSLTDDVGKGGYPNTRE